MQPPPAYSRDIRPTQPRGLQDYGGSILRPSPSPHSLYATPNISQSPVTAVGTIIPPGRRYTLDVSSASTQPSTAYAIPPTYSPHGAEQLGPSVPQYASGYPYPQQGLMMPPSQPHYPYPIFPRGPTHSGMPGDAPLSMYGTASLQLPPIRPAPQRSFEPAMAQQQRQAQQLQHQQQRQVQESSQRSDDGTRLPDPKRPRMDIKGILHPRND
jgi:hypothetical protein